MPSDFTFLRIKIMWSWRFLVFAVLYIAGGYLLFWLAPLFDDDRDWVVVFFAYVVICGIGWQFTKRKQQKITDKK